MTATRTTGGLVGATAALSAKVLESTVPVIVLTGEFTATATTGVASAPAGVSAADVRVFAHGAPTTGTVVVQGSADGGTTWVTLADSTIISGPQYTLLRVVGTIVGGTSPTLTFVALCKA